jgi:hypothetical protein
MFEKTKKLLILLGLCIGLHCGVFAQMSNSRSFDKTFSLGLKGGINIPRMWYFNNDELSQLPQSFVITPTGGVFLDIPITDVLYLSPEADYVQRGTDISYVHRTGANVHYSLSASYVDLRLPLEMCWEIKPYFQPYVSVGAEMGVCISGKIHMDRKFDNPADIINTNIIPYDETIDVNSSNIANITWPQNYEQFVDALVDVFNGSNMSLVHAGAFAGVGIRSKVSIGYQDVLLKLNMSYHQGFVDTYSYYEKSGDSQSLNVQAYQITGWRLPQGLEVTLGVAIPLKPMLKDACSSFSNDRYRRHGNRGHLYGY